MKYSEYGHFSADETSYVITERKTPRHWYNYFFNATFNSFASQVGYGEGFAEDCLGSRIFLISDRCVYVTDKESGAFHTAVGLPMTEKFDFYECRHARGSTTIVCEKNGIRTEYTLFVPEKGEFEQWIVRVTNRRKSPAKLGVIGYVATETDNVYRPQGYNSEEAHYDAENGLIYSTMMTKIHHKRLSKLYPYFACDGTPDAYDTRKTAFIGTYGTKDAPEALTDHGGCTNSDCFVEKVCYALEKDVELDAGESVSVYFRIGYAIEKENLSAVKADIGEGGAEKLLAEVMRRRAEELSGVTIKTPDEKLNHAFEFYKYATLMGSRWARVRHNGFRDRTSDSECLAVVNPTLAWGNIKLALSYQYASGYAPRTVIDGAIRPNRFSDNAVCFL